MRITRINYSNCIACNPIEYPWYIYISGASIQHLGLELAVAPYVPALELLQVLLAAELAQHHVALDRKVLELLHDPLCVCVCVCLCLCVCL
jgi:hypothetical protein